MKIRFAAFAFAFVVFGNASAQQQQQQHTQQPAPHAVRNPYPMPAAVYEVQVTKILDKIRNIRPVGPITQGDINQFILRFRDCTASAEADGRVTLAEVNHCNKVMADLKREKTHEVMMSSSPDQWAQWAHQNQAVNGHR